MHRHHRLLLTILPFILLGIAVASCSRDADDDLAERVGPRCENVRLTPDRVLGYVSIDGLTVIPPSGSVPVGCHDEDGVLVANWYSGEQIHSFVAELMIFPIPFEVAANVTSDARSSFVQELAAALAQREVAAWADMEVAERYITMPDLDCAQWEFSTVMPAFGNDEILWPLTGRWLVCLDPANPPSRAVRLTWSERHSPSIPGLYQQAAAGAAVRYFRSLGFEPAADEER